MREVRLRQLTWVGKHSANFCESTLVELGTFPLIKVVTTQVVATNSLT